MGIEPATNAPAAPEQVAVEAAAARPHAIAGYGPTSGLAAVLLTGAFAFLVLYATQPILPLLRTVFQAGEAGVSLTVSAAALGVALGAPWMGALAQRLGRKRVVVTSILLLAVPTMLAATAHSLPQMVLWRFLQGLVLPGIFAAAIAYVTEEWSPGRVPVVMSLYITGTVLGGFCGRLISGLVAAHFGWRWSFLALGVLTLAGAGFVARWLPREGRSGGNTQALPLSPGSPRELLRGRLPAVYAVGFGILFALVAVFTYVTFYLHDPPFGLSTQALSLLFSIYLVGVVVTPAAGLALPRFGLRRSVALSSLAVMAGALLTLVAHLGAVIAGLTLVSCGVFVIQSAATSYLREAAPANIRAMAAGAYLSAYYLGGTVGGEAPALLWSRFGWAGCVVLVIAVQAAVLAAAWRGWE